MVQTGPSETKQSRFSEIFKNLQDPRRTSKGNILFSLDEILFLSISAIVCGANTWTGIARFGERQLNWLRNHFEFKEGTPSHDTIGTFFSLLDTVAFGEAFTKWMEEISGNVNGKVVAIDGKRLRGSFDTADNKAAIHMVSAFVVENGGICLGQVETDTKSNEITAIPKLLDMLSLEGSTITIDAMGCQKKIINKIVSKEADYVIAIKANQGNTLEQAKKVFSVGSKPDFNESVDSGHGRVETRKCYMTEDLRFFDDKEKWNKLRSVIKIESERYLEKTGKTSKETRYYISSHCADALKLNRMIRSHWGIENNLHWTLDVVFREDHSRKRKGYSASNFSLLAKSAMTLLDKEKTMKDSKPNKRLATALDPEYRSLVIGVKGCRFY